MSIRLMTYNLVEVLLIDRTGHYRPAKLTLQQFFDRNEEMKDDADAIIDEIIKTGRYEFAPAMGDDYVLELIED